MLTQLSVREIWVVHHSHTDYGYTSHPDIVEEKHLEFIDQAVALCEGNEDHPERTRYRWTCESSWIVKRYFQKRPPGKWKAFLKRIEAGDIEVAALPLQPTPLADARTIAAGLEVLKILRSEGIPISVALGADINGLSWPWADALLDAGVEALAMAMNFVCGGGLPRWTGFHWRSPGGRRLLCWQGTHYNQGAYWGLNHDVYGSEEVAPDRLQELVEYPHPNLLLQVTNIPPDNAGPHPHYLKYIERYNELAEKNQWPPMRTATLREWFDDLARQETNFPVHEGDWTDWWASGVASTPRETAALLEAQRRIGVAEKFGIPPEMARGARERIFVAAEHTWGASTSVSAPWQLSSVAGLAAKQNLIYQAAYFANEALNGALEPNYALRDPRYGSFDPFWQEIAKDALSTPDEHPLRKKIPQEAAPDWNEWIGSDFGEVIAEEPVDGERGTWFKKGRFNRPESHGQWPENPQWKRSPLPESEREVLVEKDVMRVTLNFSINTNGRPCAAYIRFPFSRPMDAVLVDVGGAWADPRRQQVPGSCVNWWTVHQGVLLLSDAASFLWTSWDAPLVMFDAICPSPPKLGNDLSRPVLISWAYHNYWGTNFAAVQHGDLRFRYRIKYWPYRVSREAVLEYWDSDPLADYPDAALRNTL